MQLENASNKREIIFYVLVRNVTVKLRQFGEIKVEQKFGIFRKAITKIISSFLTFTRTT
jgi:hypothetical protein